MNIHAWPFNTKSLGYNSICRFIDETLEANPRAAARLEGGKDLVTKLSSGDGVDRPVKRFLQRAEMDAHKLDGRFSVALPLPEGGHNEQIIHRLWVIGIIDVYSRLVLGYHLSLRREVSKDDVMRALQSALSQWKPRRISFSETPCAHDAGFLSAEGAEFSGLCWDEMSVDGALAETCKTVKLALSEVVRSTLVEPKTDFPSAGTRITVPSSRHSSGRCRPAGFKDYRTRQGQSRRTKEVSIRIRSRWRPVFSMSTRKNCWTC
ncbi:MAG: hypothetical protein U0984_06150 [Prosthecobacter sp.]|nr:hypothetical protein [Prosthecobacter sp.]